MHNYPLRQMKPEDRNEISELIYLSINVWYQLHALPPPFRGGPEVTELFYDVYESLEGSEGIVVKLKRSDRLVGSCFYHIRPTHVSLGIMNVHPNYFGQGIARTLLNQIIQIAENEKKPIRLVSSALNLDSFSLYTRAGFIPRYVYQDMIIDVPSDGLNYNASGSKMVRDATMQDISEMSELEINIVNMNRASDYRHIIENKERIWHMSVFENKEGKIDGFLVSCTHPAVNMLGPGVARTEDQAVALILKELNRYRGRKLLLVVPVEFSNLIKQIYSWGGKNCELHFCQVRGIYKPIGGITMPGYMPETC